MFVSNGALVAKSPTLDPSFFPRLPPMASAGWATAAYGHLYTAQLWVYVLVSKRARATARLPLPVYRRNGRDRVRDDEHPMAAVLRTPNPAMSGFDLWLWTSSTFDIYGEAVWYKDRSGDRLRIYPLHPTALTKDPETGRWSFDNGKLRLADINPSDLVHYKSYNPNDLTRGLSPLEPLRSTLENEHNARTATSSFWARGARPGTYLSTKGKLTPPAIQRLKEQMDSITAGSDKTGVTVVLEEGLEPHPMTLTAEEAQYIETRRLNREEACAAYDVPPPVVHILDRATFSNITEQMRSMYRDTMAPHLRGFEATLERELRVVEWPNDPVYAEFLMDEVLRGDFETRQDALNKADYMTIAEKRKLENLPEIEGTDRIFLNTAVLPLDAIDARAAVLNQRLAEGGAGALESIAGTTARSVMGRLSRQSDLDEIEPKSLVRDLDAAESGVVLEALSQERAAGGDVLSLRERIRGLVKE